MKEIHNNDLKQQLMSESAFKDCFLTDVSADTRLFHFLARDYIVQEGQQPSWLFYLTRGRARLYATLANGRVSLIDFFAAPCFIGEIELIDKDHEPRAGNDSNLLIVFYVQIMPDDFVMQLHRF